MKSLLWSLVSLFVLTGNMLLAAEPAPLKALLISGGGYHDYKNQKEILTTGISKRANVQWTVVIENPKPGDFPKVFAKEDWISGYDVIVHNQCFAKYKENAGIDKIVKQHLDAEVGVLVIFVVVLVLEVVVVVGVVVVVVVVVAVVVNYLIV